MMRSKFGSLQAALLAGSLSMGVSSLAQAEDAKEEHWYDGLKLGAFVDAYGAIRSDNKHKFNAFNARNPTNVTVVPGTSYNPGSTGPYGHDAYVESSGFALAFAGVDVAYSAEKFGATVSLRFGPGVARFYGGDQGQFGIDNILQAYATWKPFSKLTLDIGQFYTIYGAEVAESWRNMNYSRGGLYYAMQPFWHTGLRANIAINDKFALNALVVNGVNSAFDGNKSPSLGLQALITPYSDLFMAVGYLGGLNPRSGDDETMATKNFQNFLDAVITYTHGGFKAVFNADLNLYKQKYVAMDPGVKNITGKSQNWWGVSLAPGYSFTNWFGIAARVEYLSDSANQQLAMVTKSGDYAGKQVHLTTLTGTLDFKPAAGLANLILRPEFRYEIASDENYYKWGNSTGFTKNFWSAHLGVVVTSMP